MSGLSATYKNNSLDSFLGQGFSRPVTVWIALYTAAPTESGGGTQCTGGSYSRVSLTNDSTTWPNAAAGVKVNGIAIIFPAVSAPWGSIVAWGIHAHATSDLLIAYGLLIAPKTPAIGVTPTFNIGALRITAT